MLMISALPLWSLGSGRGAASFARTLQGLSERNVRIHLLSGTRLIGPLPEGVTCDVFEPRWLTRLFRVRGFTWCSRSAAWFLFHGWALLKGATHFRRTRPDCIYGYEIQGAPAASLLGRLFRCPSISRFQGTILFPHLASRRWRLYYWDHVLALRAPTDLVIMTNDGTQGNIVLRRLGVPDERVRFWMNGVDAPEHDPGRGTPSLSEDSLDGSDPDLTAFKDQGGRVLVTVSRLVSWKRVDRVIRAMPRILQSRPTTMLVVVGDGATRTEYEALAASLGVSHRVRFVGAVAQTEVPKYLRQADVFVSLFDLSI